MKLCSTRDRRLSVSFTDAVRLGLAKDGGLFMPSVIPTCPEGFLRAIGSMTFAEISFEVARRLLGGEIPEGDLRGIVEGAVTFDAPLRVLDEDTAVLELFHGPTLAFKDFGARFMAGVMSYIRRGESSPYTVLVATSGDTGSAVAGAFHGLPGASVVLLYPSGKVSDFQERQLTSFGGNVAALEIDGTFDDCQALVKEAFADARLASRRHLTSANSINVARLIPQTFYYFNAYARMATREANPVFSVPSGNLGNLTAGLIAQKMGLPARHFVAALNANDVAGRYIATGTYAPARAVATISNAMDVGDPGNLPRIRALFNDDVAAIRAAVSPFSCTDDATRDAIAEVYDTYGYVLDPHGAVAYAALGRYRTGRPDWFPGIVLETAHPAKFIDAYDGAVRGAIRVPARLQNLAAHEKHSRKLPARFGELHAFLMEG